MGVTGDMLESAREMGVTLDRIIEGLKATQDSLKTLQNFAKRLSSDADNAYSEAKVALESKNEELARTLLLKRTQIQEKLKKTLIGCADEKKRLAKMEENVRVIEERAIEMETLLRRNIGAQSLLDTSMQF